MITQKPKDVTLPDTLEQTSRGPLVLLFYDGYELRAKPGIMGALSSQTRRILRYTKRNLYREQVRSGFYTWFLALVNSLKLIGCDVRVNNFTAARKRPHYPIGLVGYSSIINKIDLPNPRIFGPGDFGTPPPASVAVAADPRFKKLIQPSDWSIAMYRPFCGDKLLKWFAGIDTKKFPDLSKERKDFDFIVYDKIRWYRDERIPSILNRIIRHLDEMGHSYTVLRYGRHHHSQYLHALRRSKAMIFICEHETQGLAYQEAMSCNIPVLAWDEGELVDPTLTAYVNTHMEVTSVPYFDDECGMKFKMANFEQICDEFWQKLSSFNPRHYVENNLSPELSATHYLAEYAQLLSTVPLNSEMIKRS